MSRTRRKKWEIELGHMRTHALLGHAMVAAGMFQSDHEEIALPDLVLRLTRAQGRRQERSARSRYADLDIFAERRLERWIRGEAAAGHALDRTLAAWDEAFPGAARAYLTGPIGSNLFVKLAQPFESMSLKELDAAMKNSSCFQVEVMAPARRLSSNVRIHLAQTWRTLAPSAEGALLDFIGRACGYLRFALLTHHSIDYLFRFLADAIRQLKENVRSVTVTGKGKIVHPLSPDLLDAYLASLVKESSHFMLREQPQVAALSERWPVPATNLARPAAQLP